MRAEPHRFAESLGVDAERFVAMSYQDLWRGIEENAGREHADYVRWVGSRYFPSPAW